MRAFTVTLTSTPTSLATALDTGPRHTHHVALQAPEANANTAYFGSSQQQPFELRPKANAMIPQATFADIYIKGTSPDTLVIALLST